MFPLFRFFFSKQPLFWILCVTYWHPVLIVKLVILHQNRTSYISGICKIRGVLGYGLQEFHSTFMRQYILKNLSFFWVWPDYCIWSFFYFNCKYRESQNFYLVIMLKSLCQTITCLLVIFIWENEPTSPSALNTKPTHVTWPEPPP